MPFGAEDTCLCENCQKYRAAKREAEQTEMDAQVSSFEFDGLSEAGRDVLGYHRVVNKMISLKLAEPSEDNAIAVMHELMHITDNDKNIIAREVVASAKEIRPKASTLLDVLFSSLATSLKQASEASTEQAS